jgi:hypothetical protein
MMNENLNDEIRGHLAVILGKEEGDLSASLVALDGLKGSVKGHLAHYLAKRSYEKAWILLGGGDPEKGVCS